MLLARSVITLYRAREPLSCAQELAWYQLLGRGAGVADGVGVVGMSVVVDVVVRGSVLGLPPQSAPRAQSETHIDECNKNTSDYTHILVMYQHNTFQRIL